MPRTHDDSWDLASSVGATATMVATSRAMASRGPEPLLDDPFAEPLVRAVGLAPFVRILDGDLSLEDDPMLNRKTRTEQMAVRTRFFDDFFTGAAASGIRQAVILASGLDTRGYRLPWGDGVVVYEIDQPEVIEFKTRTLSDLGAAPTAELRTVAIDLREDWPAALRDKGFDASQPTAWSAEGLLPYLPADAQDRLFDNITALSAAGSRARHRARPRPERLHQRTAAADQRALAQLRFRPQRGRPVLCRRSRRRRRLPHRARLAGGRAPSQRAVRPQRFPVPRATDDGGVRGDELRQRDAEEIGLP